MNLRLDTDGDGFADWIEIALSTDPDDGAAQPTDENLNGIADAFEASRAGVGGGDGPVLPGMPEGDVLFDSFTVNNIVDLTVIQQYRVIEGSLTINSTQLTRIILPNLERVGYISIQSNDLLTQVDLPRLATVTGYVIIGSNHRLPELAVPALTSVGEYLHVSSNRSLVTVRMPRLESINEELHFSSNNVLEDMAGSFPTLETVGGHLLLQANAVLTTLGDSFGVLTSIGGYLKVYQNNAMTTFGTGFSRVETIGGQLSIWQNDALLEARFPVLTTIGDHLSIGGYRRASDNNDVIRHIGFPALATIHGRCRTRGYPAECSVSHGFAFDISHNTQLPSCIVAYYMDPANVAREEGVTHQTGNRPDCECALADGEMRAVCPDD